MSKFEKLFAFLTNVDTDIQSYLRNSPANLHLQTGHRESEHLEEAVWSYVLRPAKRLRPAVLLLACGAVGGDPKQALPAAAGVELFHTWTLVHDDIIDRDHLRRGAPTVHAAASKYGREHLGLSQSDAAEFGIHMAILAGDAQTGWSTALFAECGLRNSVDPLVILTILHHLQSKIVAQLIAGETLDVEFSLLQDRLSSNINEEKILDMLWLKTGVLYEFAGRAGAMIGKNTAHLDDPQVESIARFAGRCGTAFQLQDDIIGVLGDEAQTGKPFGSDIREGKLTLVLYEAYKNASESDRATLSATLGNRNATDDEVKRVAKMLLDLGGVGRAATLAKEHICNALPMLETLTDSESRQMLESWADFMIDRKF